MTSLRELRSTRRDIRFVSSLAIVPVLTILGTARAQTPPVEAPLPAVEAPVPVEVAPAPAPPAAEPVPVARPTAPVIRVAVPEPKPEPCPCKEDEPSEGSGSFFIGAGAFDFAALNRRLRANGYESIDGPLTLIGGEGRAVFPSGFVAGAHGGAILSPDGRGPGTLERTFGGGFGMLDLGLALLQKPSFLLTMTSGLGGYGMSLGISEGGSARFDDVLAEPRRSSSLGRGGLLVGLTLGADGRVPLGQVERGRRGFFTLGARLSALYGPPLGSWGMSEGGSATAGPGPGLAGLYAALAIGFGGAPVAGSGAQ